MAYGRNDAVIVVVSQGDDTGLKEALVRFRDRLHDKYHHLFIGPVRHVVNGGENWVLLPSGTKTGWPEEEEFNALRDELLGLVRKWRFEDGSGADAVAVSFGSDYGSEHGTTILFSTDEEGETHD